MASNLTRYTNQLFGSAAGTNQIAQFGSLFAGTPQFVNTGNIETMMSLSNWLTGWDGAAIGGNSPAIEDMNAFCTVMSYQIGYIMQKGIPAWDSGTTYFTNDMVSSAGKIYISVQDTNLNNAVSMTAWWTLIAGNVTTTLGDLTYGGTAGAITRLAGVNTAAPFVLSQTGTGSASAAPVWRQLLGPTQQIFIGGTGTYNPTSSPFAPVYIKVRMWGGGGGGCGSSTSVGFNASAGGNTTLGSLLAANGGAGAAFNSTVANGGTATIAVTSGVSGISISGGYGGAAQIQSTTGGALNGGHGGVSFAGGAGGSGFNGGASGSAKANSGSGGAGGGSSGSGVSLILGGGGGAGGYIEAYITGAALATIIASGISYAVGAGGSGTVGGIPGVNGSSGGIGLIEITEFYQ